MTIDRPPLLELVLLVLALALVTPAVAADKDNGLFEANVCALLDAPYMGATGSGMGDGCSWAAVAPDGVTNHDEQVGAHASRYAAPADTKPLVDMLLSWYKQGAAEGMGKLEELKVCNGGWQLTSALPGHPPERQGFYTCGLAVVVVETKGVLSLQKFMPVAEGIKALLPSLK